MAKEKVFKSVEEMTKYYFPNDNIKTYHLNNEEQIIIDNFRRNNHYPIKQNNGS